jgi:regulator of protease activity HflC (stomatin/prohibitin superfamily)
MGPANFVSGFWEIIKEIWGWCEFITFLDEWEEGVQLRCGKFRRVVKAGWWVHWPFELDEFHTMNVKPTALELEEQALTTKDRQKVTLRGVLMWSIFDIKKAVIDVEDAEETLGDIAVGIIQDEVERTTWAQIRTPEFRKRCLKQIQKQARKWGISVSTLKFQDITQAEVFNLFGGVSC